MSAVRDPTIRKAVTTAATEATKVGSKYVKKVVTEAPKLRSKVVSVVRGENAVKATAEVAKQATSSADVATLGAIGVIATTSTVIKEETTDFNDIKLPFTSTAIEIPDLDPTAGNRGSSFLPDPDPTAGNRGSGFLNSATSQKRSPVSLSPNGITVELNAVTLPFVAAAVVGYSIYSYFTTPAEKGSAGSSSSSSAPSSAPPAGAGGGGSGGSGDGTDGSGDEADGKGEKTSAPRVPVPPCAVKKDISLRQMKILLEKEGEKIHAKLSEQALRTKDPGKVWSNQDFRVDVGHVGEKGLQNAYESRIWELQVNSGASKRVANTLGSSKAHELFKGKFTESHLEYQTWIESVLNSFS